MLKDIMLRSNYLKMYGYLNYVCITKCVLFLITPTKLLIIFNCVLIQKCHSTLNFNP